MLFKNFSPSFTPKLWTVFKDGYSLSLLRADALAGLTVAIVALPLAMALAIASGASPDKGLVTAVVAGLLISALGGSRVQIGGPTGAFVVVVFNVIAVHGYDGLLLATLLAGIILVAAGYARFGQVIKYIPHPVITGFTAGIAVIIASSQVKDFLGLRVDEVPADFIEKWTVYIAQFDTVHGVTALIGCGALAGILVMRRYTPALPAYLIVVALAGALAAFFHLPVETIGSRFPDMPTGLPLPAVPEISFAKIQAVLPSAFTIAFLAGIEALLSAVVADGMTGYKHRPNQELVGQGAANIASAFFGGLPATGALARTATNIKAGGKTPMAGIFHALFLLAFILFATDIMRFVPLAALAAVLFVVAWGMSEIRQFIHIFKLSASDRTVLLLTFFLTVLGDLTVAIGVGVILASLLFMRQMSKSVRIAHDRESGGEDEEEGQRDALPDGVEVFRISGPVFFGVAGDLLEALKQMGRTPDILIVRMRHVPYLDTSGEQAMRHIVQTCRARGTKVIFSALQDQPRQILARGGIHAYHPDISMTPNYKEAVALAQRMTAE